MNNTEIYKIAERQGDVYVVDLNADHAIYRAHFPGQPITPGVVIMEVCRQLMCLHVGCDVRLVGAKNVKFLAPLSPVEHPRVRFAVSRVKQDGVVLTATWEVNDADLLISKLSLIFET